MEDFKSSFTVAQSPKEVFDAITNVRGWWSEALEGASKEAGDEFVYRYKGLHYSKHRVTEVVPNKKVVWLTTDSKLNFEGHEGEWTGTSVIFDVSEREGETVVEFSHKGLVPQLACHDACTGAWGHYIQSLQSLIATGSGDPDSKSAAEKI
jgi:uncharacterized protein YndB with AHSA1/START domain